LLLHHAVVENKLDEILHLFRKLGLRLWLLYVTVVLQCGSMMGGWVFVFAVVVDRVSNNIQLCRENSCKHLVLVVLINRFRVVSTVVLRRTYCCNTTVTLL
jgi:hypothetical protein